MSCLMMCKVVLIKWLMMFVNIVRSILGVLVCVGLGVSLGL